MTNAPHVDDIVKDADVNKVGKVMGFVGPYVQLRPLGGGKEWDARFEHLEPVDTAEALSAGVAEANARSRRGAAMAASTAQPDAEDLGDTPHPSSAECALAKRPGYEDLHDACRQTRDVWLPGANDVLLVARCGCRCHAISERRPAAESTSTS